MSADTLRKLGIEINLEGNFMTNLDQAQARLDSLKRSSKQTGAALVGALGALGSVLALSQIKSFVQEGISFGDQIADQAMRLGVSGETLQKWGFIAEKAGMSTEAMGKGVSFLNKTLGEAQKGEKGASETFAEMGIRLKNTDGSFKDTSQVLLEFSDVLAKQKTPAQKAALGAKLMGKAGKELGVVLGQGSKALKGQIGLLEEMGGVLKDKTSKEVDDFADRMIAVKKGFQVARTELVARMLPALELFSNILITGSRMMKEFDEKTGLAKVGLIGMAGAAVIAAGAFGLAWLPQLLKFGKLAIGVGLLYIIFEDLYGLFTGKLNSASEQFIKHIYGVEDGTKYVNALRVAFEEMPSPIKVINDELDDMITKIELAAEFRPGGAFDPTSSRTIEDFRRERRKQLGLPVQGEVPRFDLADASKYTAGVVNIPLNNLAGDKNTDTNNRGAGFMLPRPAPTTATPTAPPREFEFGRPAKQDPNAISLMPQAAAPVIGGATQSIQNNSTNAPSNTTINNNVTVNGGNPGEVVRAFQKMQDNMLLNAKEDFKTIKTSGGSGF